MNDLSTVINDLADVSHRIRHVIDVSVSQANNASDNTLIRLCRESQDIAGEMNSALLSLQAKGTSKLGQAKSSVIVALKAMWSKDKLAKLEQRLQQIRSEMTMAMLVVLWEKERRRDDKGDSELKNQIEEISKAVNRNNGMLDDFLRELDATASDDDKLGPVRRQRLLSVDSGTQSGSHLTFISTRLPKFQRPEPDSTRTYKIRLYGACTSLVLKPERG